MKLERYLRIITKLEEIYNASGNLLSCKLEVII